MFHGIMITLAMIHHNYRPRESSTLLCSCLSIGCQIARSCQPACSLVFFPTQPTLSVGRLFVNKLCRPNIAVCVDIVSDLVRVINLNPFYIFFSRYDDVKMYVGRRLLRRLTGTLRQKDKVVSIQGTSEVVRVVFRSDRSVTRRGFLAKYSVMKGD